MISIGIQWTLMVASAYLWGLGIMKIAKIDTKKAKNLELILFLGLCFLTVYAELFSLVTGVGMAALGGMAIIDIALVFINRKTILGHIKLLEKRKWYRYLLVIIVAIVLLILSSRMPIHYDTGLYHAQAVRWIEEYGVVPGLGNLHNRLAYNSSIFCLDALMGLKPILHQNIHGVDGFFELILISYSILSFKGIKEKKLYTSDALRIALFIFLTGAENILLISSLGSDIPALGLMLYIVIKWISLIENQEQEDKIQLMSLLCVLAVFGATVKLSVALVILITLYPVIEYIRHKDVKNLIKYLVLGFVVIAPFLIRNVIISGYLIYPYPELDFFDVDWKMNAYTCLFDRYEIQAWGRGLKNVYRYDATISEWFPVWWDNLSLFTKIVFVCNPISIIGGMVYSVIRIIKKKSADILAIMIAVSASCILWFTGSPDSRYGGVFVSIAPFVAIGYALYKLDEKLKKSTIKSVCIVAISIALVGYTLYPYGKSIVEGDNSHILRCADYEWKTGQLVEIGDQMLFAPESGDQAGYNLFPSSPYPERVKKIEFRGDSIADGFKVKDEYVEANLTTYGSVDEVRWFE